jgi:ABC-type amino acid transport substrate-binding protein
MSISRLDEIRTRGVIRISAHWDNTSAQYLDPDSGEPAGIVGPVGQLLAQDLGVRPEFVELPWADHIPALLAGQVDISVKHTLTPQRALEVDFSSHSILCEEGQIIVQCDRDWQIEADLNRPERVIAVAMGSSQEIHVRRRYALAKIRLWPTAREALEAVATGQADACLHDTLVPGFLAEHPACTTLTGTDGRPVIPYRDCVHPCLKPGDQRFLNWLNSWMAFHKASGTFDDIVSEAEAAFQATVRTAIDQGSKPGAPRS